MTKDQLQQELDEKIKPGVKPSDLKKLKRSKSADDIVSPSTPNIPLKKSQSQLEIPTAQQPSSEEQITQLKEQVKFHAETAQNYLQSLQTSQAKVSELEEKIKNNPPNPLLQEQLKTKQKEVEELRKKLENTNTKLTETTAELDNSLLARHQGLKDWFQHYQKTKQLEQELAENINEASDELISQDQVISVLHTENNQLKLTNRSLQKDLNLAQRLAELRKYPLPNSENNWDYLKYPLYSLVIVLFTLWITNNLSKEKHYGT